MPDTRDSRIASFASRLSPHRQITVLTGAGVSAASDIPTFRRPEGLWRDLRPEELAIPEAFGRNPTLIWEWYDWRRWHVAAARPNRAHDILAQWSRAVERFTLIAQDVDGLHERAGAKSVVRFHPTCFPVRDDS